MTLFRLQMWKGYFQISIILLKHVIIVATINLYFIQVIICFSIDENKYLFRTTLMGYWEKYAS